MRGTASVCLHCHTRHLLHCLTVQHPLHHPAGRHHRQFINTWKSHTCTLLGVSSLKWEYIALAGAIQYKSNMFRLCSAVAFSADLDYNVHVDFLFNIIACIVCIFQIIFLNGRKLVECWTFALLPGIWLNNDSSVWISSLCVWTIKDFFNAFLNFWSSNFRLALNPDITNHILSQFFSLLSFSLAGRSAWKLIFQVII